MVRAAIITSTAVMALPASSYARAFVGGIAALASGEKKRREREAVYQEDYEAPPVDGEEGSAPLRSAGSPVVDIPAPARPTMTACDLDAAGGPLRGAAAEADAQRSVRDSHACGVNVFT